MPAQAQNNKACSGKEYTTSKVFDATDATDLKQIINALQYVKAYIERNV